VMTCMRYVLEHMDHYRWFELMRSSDPRDKIHNSQVIQYSRRNPADAGDVREEFTWTRSVCPWDETLSNNLWTEIAPVARYSSDQLIKRVEDK